MGSPAVAAGHITTGNRKVVFNGKET